MKTSKQTKKTFSRHDYGPALQGALAWLGDRYLLAEPLNRRNDGRQLQAEEPQRSQPASTAMGVMA